MDTLHILWTPRIARPWWPTNQRFPKTPKTLVTDCCCCRMKRADTIARLVDSWEPPLGGFGCYQEEPDPWEPDRCNIDPHIPTGAYYDATIEIECAPDKGCKINPRRKFGMALRECTRGGY